MSVFELRDKVIGDYRSYVTSFMKIRDPRIREFVDEELASGALWPDPLIQLNPSYDSGGTIDELVSSGQLHPECARIFRRGKTNSSQGDIIRLHEHQRRAIEVASGGNSYVLTTGTGSGKSLAYFVPIVDHVLRKREQGGKRKISAIVVYPMNALCNSQELELEKFLRVDYGAGNEPVSFARYTGQEDDERRRQIVENPPDILLTNFMMLELILTRPMEPDSAVVRAAQGLDFFVLDELHTYRGRQGADVAMLVRRLRQRLDAPAMQCVGTSATIAGSGSRDERLGQVAEVASRIFGTNVSPDHVIDETLRQITPTQADTTALAERLRQPAVYPDDWDRFISDPLVSWIERNIGLTQEEGRLQRASPMTIADARQRLAVETSISEEVCERQLQACLLKGFAVKDPEIGNPVFAFRLHQFVSRGDTVYSSLEAPESRFLSLGGQRFVPDDRSKILLPLAFCRQCGQEYNVVDWDHTDDSLAPREISARSGQDDPEIQSGLIAIGEGLWSGELEDLPDDWLEQRDDGPRLVRGMRDSVPVRVRVAADGEISAGGLQSGVEAWFVPAPMRLCVRCGVAYRGRQSDFTKLGALATEGRSTSTTIIAAATVRALRNEEGVPKNAQKLLSFTDNRQDASLQAGHFNDFVQIAMLRAALYGAIRAAGDEGLTHESMPTLVTDALDLDYEDYAINPADQYSRDEALSALRRVVGYRLYVDQQRGWRINAPNLEQTGLLRVDYARLVDVAGDEQLWETRHDALRTATPEQREAACRQVLDVMRRELALTAEQLEQDEYDRVRIVSEQQLTGRWALDPEQDPELFRTLRLGSARNPRRELPLSNRSALGRYLASPSTWPNHLSQRMPGVEFEPFARDLLDVLAETGFVRPYGQFADPQDAEGRPLLFRLNAARIRWKEGTGVPPHDHTRMPQLPDELEEGNSFFQELYQGIAQSIGDLEAREHTAQVTPADREEREARFREGKLPVLFCSPTMELGVDIADLSAVNLRNVPPTPANYAQRSGRAGRGGQPALVVTYCSSRSAHDQYYFAHRTQMVAGAVAPPRLDLANEDLIRSHVHAEWLAAAGQSLSGVIAEAVVDITNEEELPLAESLRVELSKDGPARRAEQHFIRILSEMAGELRDPDWLDDQWLARVLDSAPVDFNRAFDRWRTMYRSALNQRDDQTKIATNPMTAPADRQRAERLPSEAIAQLALLRSETRSVSSDFYPYRYLASEGFLPGYNFPRLPVSAFLPGQRVRGRREYSGALTRPRFLAVSEFGPRALIYHEGARYRVQRVLLPPATEEGVRTRTAKFCANCGYGHFEQQVDDDVCAGCGQPMEGDSRRYENLLWLTGVATRREFRITSDEEERLRLGYEVLTTYTRAEGDNGPRFTKAEYVSGDQVVASAEYAPTATLWRLNVGWMKRRMKEQHGFVLNLATGAWARGDEEELDDPDGTDQDAREAGEKRRVIPYVEDRRNALLLRTTESVDESTFASVQYALKRGIETLYQLEPSELAAEPLPRRDKRLIMLFFEASEGGAGILNRVALEENALAAVAREALRLLHFDPDTGDDLHRADGAKEDCAVACYDCLLSYSNQPDHELLDRVMARDTLMQLAGATTRVGAGTQTRAAQLERLMKQSSTDLERDFLRFLEERGLRLPDEAQWRVNDPFALPDFYYRESRACVYVDGPHHEYADRAARDSAAREQLDEAGYEVIVFSLQNEWDTVARDYSFVFGGAEG